MEKEPVHRVSIPYEPPADDNVLFISSIALLAALAVIMNTEKINYAASYSVIFSSTSFGICLLGALWYKFREPLRAQLYKTSTEELSEKYTKKFQDFFDGYISPYALLRAREEVAKEKPKVEEIDAFTKKLGQKIIEERADLNMEVIDSYISNLSLETREAYKKCYNGPLPERFSKIRQCLDLFFRMTRYPFFIVGLIFFIAAIFFFLQPNLSVDTFK